jgi:ABC-2 type transport system ATP-binding protein
MMIVETENLGRRFLRHQALRDVSLQAPPGAALALVGANGAGKTTLLRILVNILRPSGGAARVMGKDSRRLTAADFNRIGYVAENQKLPERLSVAHFFDYLRPLYAGWDRELEHDLRTRLDLPADRPLSKLSHGMRMKVMLAGALAFRPALLLLDEPLSGLDPLTRDEIVEGLIGQADETTIVISSHEMAEVDGLATHVAYMSRGRFAFQSPTEELLGRFREVAVTFEAAPADTDALTAAWLAPKLFERTLRFTDSAYAGEAPLGRALTDRFGPIVQLDARPMSLRDVSKALMLASRKEPS